MQPTHEPIGDVEECIGEPLPADHDPWGEQDTVEEEPDDGDPGA